SPRHSPDHRGFDRHSCSCDARPGPPERDMSPPWLRKEDSERPSRPHPYRRSFQVRDSTLPWPQHTHWSEPSCSCPRLLHRPMRGRQKGANDRRQDGQIRCRGIRGKTRVLGLPREIAPRTNPLETRTPQAIGKLCTKQILRRAVSRGIGFSFANVSMLCHAPAKAAKCFVGYRLDAVGGDKTIVEVEQRARSDGVIDGCVFPPAAMQHGNITCTDRA